MVLQSHSMHEPDVAISQPSLVDGNATLRLILLSAYLFIGKEGEPRVGTGCDHEQDFRYNCTGNVEDPERYCQFYRPADRNETSRVYLAMRHADGFLDTVSVEGIHAGRELRFIANSPKHHRRFITIFKLTKVNSSTCIKNGVSCYSLSVGNHSLTVFTTGSRNISKLHKKAITSIASCMARAGPFQQIYGASTASGATAASPLFITFDKPWKGGPFPCVRKPFLTTTCKFGRLKRTYPIGHVNATNL